jgi:hypothetical protein
MRKSFRPFGTDNNVVGPVETENLIEKEFESVARDIDVTVTNTRFNTMMQKLFKLVGGDLEGRLANMLFQDPQMREIMVLSLRRITTEFHLELHRLKMR